MAAATREIRIRGARENNLRGVDLTIPKHAITIFTGVSDSGKSSIVFDTVATEAQRQLYENFSMFIRSFLPKYPPPAAAAIENLNMAVIFEGPPAELAKCEASITARYLRKSSAPS